MILKSRAGWLLPAFMALALVMAGTAGHAQDKTGNKNMWGKDIVIEPAHGLANLRSELMRKRANEVAWMFGVPRHDFFTLHAVGSQDNHGAIAELSGDKRRIYYGHAFDSGFENNALESFVVLSHEMAHHLLGHIRDDSTTAAMELDADGLAACIVHALIAKGFSSQNPDLPRLKGTLAEVKAIYDGKPSDAAHPPASVRQAQVQKGWDFYATRAAQTDSGSPCGAYLAKNAN